MAVKDIKKEELRELIKAGKAEIIDVREPSEYEIIHIKNSKLIPMKELLSRVDEIDWEKEVVFICRSGARSKMIANIISSMDKNINNLQYGIFDCFSDKNGKNLKINQEQVNNYFS
jgi:rhodanese-related sulfurtransferase